MPIRIAEVAARAGVSPATVSRVLNDVSSVDADLADRVRSAVAALRYEPNRVARNLRRQRVDMIGVLISDIQNPHFAELVRGIERAAFAAGYRVLLCNTDEDPDKQTTYLRILTQERVAGIILSPTRDLAGAIADAIRTATPVVAVDRAVDADGADSVLANNARAAELATTRLLAAGHRSVGLIAGPAEVATAAERREGYVRAMGRAGLTPIVEEADFRAEGGQRAMERLLRHPDSVTAVVISNNLMTAGALGVLAAERVAIPDRLALISFDDPFWAAITNPPLTVLAQPVTRMAQRALALLIERMGGGRSEPRTERLDLDLRLRKSCGTSGAITGE